MRITMPQLGESVVEGTISRWLKQEGEQIQQYEPLLEIITDKVNAEYPSPVAGTLRRILVPEGETVEVNVEIAEIEADGEVGGEAGGEGRAIGADYLDVQMQPNVASAGAIAEEAQAEDSTQVERIESGQAATPGQAQAEDTRRYSPAVRRLAQEHNVDLAQVQGAGAGGRVTKQDVEAFIERMARSPQPAAPAVQPEYARPQEPDFARVAGRPAEARPAAGAELVPPMGATAAPAQPTAPAPVPAPAQGDELVPLSPMRKAIADHMVRSAYTSPHVTTVIEVDMTPIVRYREAAKAEFERREGVPLTYLPFVIQAVVAGLKEHRVLNSTWTDAGIMLKKQINIGIAVGMEDGLIVPVVHDADEKSLVGLARSVADLAARARSGQLTPADVQGGTFTVNNPGTFGTIMSTPIISQPQAGILSMEAIVKRPVVLDDAIAIRSMMYLSLSIDHRILDGLQAARFLGGVKQRLEGFTPESAGL